ncbi:MAG: hypothetical protein KGP29_00815 [Proteobacteria bacterium]|nr:hypothetical protein [Pseudomonadota bacterium]
MRKLKIFLPWNLPEYYASNGFHDLYDFLLEEGDFFEFKALKLKRFYGKKILRFFAFFVRRMMDFKSYNRSSSVSYLLNKIGSSFCDLELLHTSPIFANGGDPFVFHLEDFQSIFLHRDTLTVFKKDVDLKKIFEQESCLAVVSHIPETLQSFRNYFGSPIINSKLHYSRIAVSSSFTKAADSLKNFHKNPEETIFLFTSSGHQNTNNYVTRGFKVTINLAKKLIESGYKVKFVFKCIKLTRLDFLCMGLSDAQVDFIYSCESIIWYEEYLSDHEMNVLYKMADFFLLPSAQLHSMSILKSMYCGAIPIVTDTVGTDQYVDHLNNGIVLKGVKKAVFRDEVSLLKSDVENYLALEGALTEQLVSVVIGIIDQRNTIDEMRLKAKETVLKLYSSRKNASSLLSYIANECDKKIKTRRRYRITDFFLRGLVDGFLTSDFRRYKQIICQKILEWESIRVFRHHSYYYIINSSRRGPFRNLVKFPKPYKNMIEINEELRRRLFKKWKWI